MSKKKHEEVEEEEVAPFWMISFSDLMTLLLSFFVILFSLSTIETKKMEELYQAMGGRYRLGGLPKGDKVTRADPSLPKSKQPSTAQESVKPLTLEPKKTKLESTRTIIPFKLEDTDLDDNDKKELSRLAEKLQGFSFPIVVRGHASVREKSRNTIDDLAYERAWNVRQYLLTRGLDPKRFTLSIVGPHDPLDGQSLTTSFGDTNTYADIILESE